MSLTDIDRRRLEHAAGTAIGIATELRENGLPCLADRVNRVAVMIRVSLAPEIGESILPDAPLAVVTLCRFCGGTGIVKYPNETIHACPDCNATGLQSEDACNAGPVAIANNLKAVLATMEPFRVLGSSGPSRPRYDPPQVDVIDGETA